jgi:ribosome maturation factor RimP
MIDKTLLRQTVENAIADTDLFLVDVTVTPDNRLTVEVDSIDGVDIDSCVDITRKIEDTFNRDVEDYELEVGSAGLTSPFKVIQQYQKNIGNPIEVLTADGKKLKGTLTNVDADANTFVLTSQKKEKQPGQKKPVIVDVDTQLAIAECKSVRYLIEFK